MGESIGQFPNDPLQTPLLFLFAHKQKREDNYIWYVNGQIRSEPAEHKRGKSSLRRRYHFGSYLDGACVPAIRLRGS